MNVCCFFQAAFFLLVSQSVFSFFFAPFIQLNFHFNYYDPMQSSKLPTPHAQYLYAYYVLFAMFTMQWPIDKNRSFTLRCSKSSNLFRREWKKSGWCWCCRLLFLSPFSSVYFLFKSTYDRCINLKSDL